MSDIFREVEEDYRQEQLLRFWRRNAVMLTAILVVAVTIAATAGIMQSRHEKAEEQQTYALAKAIQTVSDNSSPMALMEFDQATENLTGHQKIAAELSSARLYTNLNNIPQALKLYDLVQHDPHASKAETALAEIASLGLQLDTAEPAMLTDKLTPLAAADSPWRFSAREWQGLLAVRQGNNAEAHRIFADLAQDTAAPDGVQERAGKLAQLYPAP